MSEQTMCGQCKYFARKPDNYMIGACFMRTLCEQDDTWGFKRAYADDMACDDYREREDER